MKVIIFFTYGISLLDWKKSGLFERELKLYEHLATNYGLEFIFVTYGDDSDLDFEINEKIQVIPIYKYISKKNNKFLEIIRSLFYARKIQELIPFENSLMKTNQLWGSWIPIIIKIRTNRPLIIRTGYDLLTFKKKSERPKIFILLYKLLTRISLYYSDYYLVSSTTDLRFLNNQFPGYEEKILKHPNWVEAASPTMKTKKDSIISVGRLEDQKNYSFLINSFSNSDFKIDIIGDGSEKESLMQLANHKNANINFIGRISNSDLQIKLTEYKYFVTSTRYEGNPKSILEAMSAGCIVIAPNVPGVNEIIENDVNGILYEFDTVDLPALIQSLDREQEKKLAKNAIDFIRSNHKLDLIAKVEANLYEELF